jgi:hypothetical protein
MAKTSKPIKIFLDGKNAGHMFSLARSCGSCGCRAIDTATIKIAKLRAPAVG